MRDHSELKMSAEAAIQAGIKNQERWPTADDWFEPDLISAEMAYVKAASPTAILELIADIGRLTSEITALKFVDARRDEYIASLIKDASRYRQIRAGSICGGNVYVWDQRGEDYQELGSYISGDNLDAAIDSDESTTICQIPT